LFPFVFASDITKWTGHPDDEAEWVGVVNTAVRTVARAHGDVVMDYHALSKVYLRYFYRLNRRTHRTKGNAHLHGGTIYVHSDSVHYVAGGFFRASLVLLRDAVVHVQRCMSGPPPPTANNNCTAQR
jgi:hypothetical protein